MKRMKHLDLEQWETLGAYYKLLKQLSTDCHMAFVESERFTKTECSGGFNLIHKHVTNLEVKLMGEHKLFGDCRDLYGWDKKPTANDHHLTRVFYGGLTDKPLGDIDVNVRRKAILILEDIIENIRSSINFTEMESKNEKH